MGLGGQKQPVDQTSKTEKIIHPVSHTILFKAPGYVDLMLPVKVPSDREQISVSLKKKAGINYRIRCILDVHAAKEDFSLVDRIIRAHALNRVIRHPDHPVSKGKAERYHQRFSFSVKDSDDFDDLIGSLFSEAEKRQLVFNFSQAETNAVVSTNPGREFRAVWISYLDWPQGEHDADSQKRMLTDMFDTFKRLGFNAVIFHTRIEGDAVYRSAVEPWSRLITGKQGRDPGYDPLEFAVTQAHKRGLELHAWINPFRLKLSMKCNTSGMADTHALNVHPEWVLKFRLSHGKSCCCYYMLDPGLPDARAYLVGIIADIVKRYDIDGIHFDDTFYPYPYGSFTGIGQEDATTYRRYGKNTGDIKDWRRNNINSFLSSVNQTVKDLKPYVRFGVSPFGIWKAGVPDGIKGMSAYDVLYSDATEWLKNRSVDYLAPQLYWKIGANPDYAGLLDWWAQKAYDAKRHIYPGQMLYYLNAPKKAVSSAYPVFDNEIVDQIHLNRMARYPGVLGNTFYRTINRNDQLLGSNEFRDIIGNSLYATPALPPVMPWINQATPRAPENLKLINENGQVKLQWQKTSEKERVWKYAVYIARREDLATGMTADAAGHLLAVVGEPYIRLTDDMGVEKGDLLFVKAVSGNNIESLPSTSVVW